MCSIIKTLVNNKIILNDKYFVFFHLINSLSIILNKVI